MRTTVAGLALGALLGLADGARAEPKAAAAKEHRRDRLDPEARAERDRMRQQLMDQLRTMRMWKLTEELKLDEATAAKLFPLLSKYDDLERDLFRERIGTHRELRQTVEETPADAARIDALAAKVAKLRDRRHALEQEKYLALRRVLTAAQMGKLLLVIPRIEDEFRQKIREAIEAGRAARREAAGDATRPERDRRLREQPRSRP